MRTAIIVILCSMLTLSFCMNIYQAVLANDMLLQSDEVLQQVQDIHEHVESMPVDQGPKTISTTYWGDYQLEVEMEGIMVWDADRYVGFLPYNGREGLHRLITMDNR